MFTVKPTVVKVSASGVHAQHDRGGRGATYATRGRLCIFRGERVDAGTWLCVLRKRDRAMKKVLISHHESIRPRLSPSLSLSLSLSISTGREAVRRLQVPEDGAGLRPHHRARVHHHPE